MSACQGQRLKSESCFGEEIYYQEMNFDEKKTGMDGMSCQAFPAASRHVFDIEGKD